MKSTKEITGIKYTDGKYIRDGDTVVLWHAQEFSRNPVPFERIVHWQSEFAAYMVSSDNGYLEYLGECLQDPNLIKITKR